MAGDLLDDHERAPAGRSPGDRPDAGARSEGLGRGRLQSGGAPGAPPGDRAGVGGSHHGGAAAGGSSPSRGEAIEREEVGLALGRDEVQVVPLFMRGSAGQNER